jgi:sterol desaturase/sphingolipid hydroxylase (fatty acid hydroxylase superfamily)
MDDIADFAIRFSILLLPTIAVVAICMVLERRWPAVSANRGDRLQNIKVWIPYLAGQFLLTPALGGFTTLAVNAVGGGLIELPSTGWDLAVGVLAYLVAMDFGEYLFHRAQHAISALWEMHSLHHSDPELDATTTVRHFWFDPLLKTVTIWLAVGLLFKASPPILAVYFGLMLTNFLTHANLHLGFGKASWIWNSPQYHRLHHAAAPEYYDCNYAALLPIFDVMFGCYRKPRPDEFPATGLASGVAPESLTEAVLWPVVKARKTGPAHEEPTAQLARPEGQRAISPAVRHSPGTVAATRAWRVLS